MPTGRGVAVVGRRPRDVGVRPDRRLARASRSWAIGTGRPAVLRRPVRAVGTDPDLVRRRLSDIRVGPGTRVTVELDVENRSRRADLGPPPGEDRLPPALGRPARLVVSGIPARSVQRVSYTVLPQTGAATAWARSRRRVRPLRADPPPARVRRPRRTARDARDRGPARGDRTRRAARASARRAPGSCSARARSTTRCASTARATTCAGIHWPSVARTGELMIRQDESSRRANGLVFIDTRAAALGQVHGQAFERAVSVGATLGVLARPARVHPAARHRGDATRHRDGGPVPRCPRRVLARAGSLDRADARPPAGRELGRYVARLRLGPAGARVSSPR